MLLNILLPSTTKEYVFVVQYIHNGTVENTCSTSTLVLFLFFWNFTITYGNYSINFQRFPHSVLWLQEAGIIVYSASLLCVSISVVFNILQLQIIWMDNSMHFFVVVTVGVFGSKFLEVNQKPSDALVCQIPCKGLYHFTPSPLYEHTCFSRGWNELPGFWNSANLISTSTWLRIVLICISLILNAIFFLKKSFVCLQFWAKS